MKQHSDHSRVAIPHIKWTPLVVYTIYRVFLSLLLVGLGLFVFHKSNQRFLPVVYNSVSIIYVIITFATLLLIYKTKLESRKLKFAIVVIDIFVITVLAHASGGLNSNLTILLVVAVAAGGIMIVGRAGTLLAAIATLAVLYEQIYYLIKFESDALFTNAGFLGITFFAVSILSQVIAQQLGESEARASLSEEMLAEWRELSILIIQRMRTGIIVLSPEGDIQLISETSMKLLELPMDAAIPKKLNETSPELNKKFLEWNENHKAASKPFQISDNGPSIRCDFTKLAEEHTASQILVFIEDATTITQQAQNLKLTSLATLTAGIAHEIRNPLGAISHAAQLLLESDQLNTQDHKLANIVQQHSVRMNNIIENVLYLSRRKKPSPSLFYLDEWLGSFVNDFKESYKGQCQINLITEKRGIEVNTDQSQMAQVLTNLIDNGLRYSLRETGKATVDLLIGLTTDGELPTLQIRDYGPGISEEQKSKLFEPFSTTEPSGTGLGLYLARELCEISHARLSLESKDGPGCCFQIVFPHPKKRISEEDAG